MNTLPSNIFEAIVIDTETTGLKEPQPVEIAMIGLKPLQSYEDQNFLVNPWIWSERFRPTKPIELGAQRVHGISMDDVRDKKVYPGSDYLAGTLNAAALQHLAEVNKEPLPRYMIAHNAIFDWKVIGCPDGIRKICTLKLAKALWPEQKSKALTKLIEVFYPEVFQQLTMNAHGALIDCKLTMLLLKQAIADNPGQFNSWDDFHDVAGID